MTDIFSRDAPTVGRKMFTESTMAASNTAWDAASAAGAVVRTGEEDGLWLLTRYDAIADAFRDWESFSSQRTDPEIAAITVSNSRMPLTVPQELDPPDWQPIRRVLSSLLKPVSSEAMRPQVRQWVDRYVDRIVGEGRCDFVTDLAVPVPMSVTMEWLGFPEEEWQPFASVFHEIAGYPPGHPVREAATVRFPDVYKACRREVEARRVQPRDDAISAFAAHRIEGELVEVDTLAHLVLQVMGGGVDTTTSVTTAALVHLGRDRALRERLRDNPSLWATAADEFLRIYPPARTFARTVTADTEVAGCPIHNGDRVVLSIVAANRDERAFERPERCEIERFPNRHLTFGMGIHRCPGSHLARIMLVEMIQCVLRRMPDYELLEDEIVEYPNWGGVGGWAHVPATFTPRH